MAFATSNVKRSYAGDLKVTCGDWSGAIGDAAGTISVEGGRVYEASFVDQDGAAPYQVSIPVKVEISGNTSVVTVYNNSTVTAGRFKITHA